ncbi:hypothetical protein AMTRI_Chr09g22880 [Amborella trichopoda]|uniref:uncharacterized protein LOC105421707 n=1 Tax=Amborella trichopoda TaxID=13333 RepID=UPI0005D44532|nr:uncharacterized protein LOC105421707 [Amborella trichopoda]|eukprot:XP_011628342.1 uncharacterized protein LOC105421707 [Amborella trichopoda]
MEGYDHRNWTDEKHMSYLSSMEASFVRRMFHSNEQGIVQQSTRLDRYMPDSADSTLDSGTRAGKGFMVPDSEETNTIHPCKVSRKKKGFLPKTICTDQVVPIFGNGKGKEEGC